MSPRRHGGILAWWWSAALLFPGSLLMLELAATAGRSVGGPFAVLARFIPREETAGSQSLTPGTRFDRLLD
jgi:hypothetical protein